jgi:hypothetical protein
MAFQSTPGFMKLDSYTGNHTDNRSLTGIGFEPAYLMVMAAHDEDAMQRFASEEPDYSLPFDNEGERGDRIQDFEPDGFQVGGHNTVNEQDETYHYVAFNRAPEQIFEDNYNGNTQLITDIISAGFRPEIVAIKQAKDNYGTVHRTGSMAGYLTLPLYAEAMFSDGIITF